MRLGNATFQILKGERGEDGSLTKTSVLEGVGWIEDEAQWRVIEGQVTVVANAILFVWDEPPNIEEGWAVVNSKEYRITRIQTYHDGKDRFHHAEVLLL